MNIFANNDTLFFIKKQCLQYIFKGFMLAGSFDFGLKGCI